MINKKDISPFFGGDFHGVVSAFESGGFAFHGGGSFSMAPSRPRPPSCGGAWAGLLERSGLAGAGLLERPRLLGRTEGGFVLTGTGGTVSRS